MAAKIGSKTLPNRVSLKEKVFLPAFLGPSEFFIVKRASDLINYRTVTNTMSLFILMINLDYHFLLML